MYAKNAKYFTYWPHIKGLLTRTLDTEEVGAGGGAKKNNPQDVFSDNTTLK